MIYLKPRRNICCLSYLPKNFSQLAPFKSNKIFSFRKTFSFYFKEVCDEEPTIFDNVIQCITAFTVKNNCICLSLTLATTKILSPRDVTYLIKSCFKIFTIKVRRPNHLFLFTPWSYFPVTPIFPNVVIYGTLYQTLDSTQFLQAEEFRTQKPSAAELQKLSLHCQKLE